MSENWEKSCVSLGTKIKDVLKVINLSEYKIAMVIDSEQYLTGIVSDGDIRRAIINNFSLDTPIDKIMCSKPISASIGTPKNVLLKLMKKHQISIVPLLSQKKLVKIVTLHYLLKNDVHNNPIFVMAGGFGTRLRPLTDQCPKPLLKIGDKPILEIIIQRFIDAGFVNFYISTHYLPEMIENHFKNGEKLGVNISYVYEKEPLGTAGALGLLPKEIEQLPLIMINGDVLTNLDIQALLKYHNQEKAVATMCVREYDYQIPYGVIEKEGNKITKLVEKPSYQFHVNAGIYVISPKLFNSVRVNTKIDMPDLLEQQIDKNELVVSYPLTEYWLDIGQMNEYRQAQRDIISLGL